MRILRASSVMLFILVFGAGPGLAAQGAIQARLDSSWSPLVGPLPEPIGKVIYVQPAGRNTLNVTWIVQGATPLTTYTAGFNIFGVPPCISNAPGTFGVVRDLCADGTYQGTTASAGVYIAGTLSTDAAGSGSFHLNLLNLPSGTWNIDYWVVPCAPPGICGFVPSASTSSWGTGPFEVVTIP